MKIVAFKTGKAKQFNYRPVYYNKEKDEMEERLKLLTKEPGADEVEIEKFRAKIKNAWGGREVKAKTTSNKTIYIYVIAVLAILYYVFIL